MSFECGCVDDARGTYSFSTVRGGALFVNKAVFPQQGMWKMARVSQSTCSPAGNNPEITCRDDALMILLMKKPGLSSAATDWKEPAYAQCNGPSPDNPSESMQSMRPPVWSWNVRGCHVWHLLEHRLCFNTQDKPHPLPFFTQTLKHSMPFIPCWDVGCWHIVSVMRCYLIVWSLLWPATLISDCRSVANWFLKDVIPLYLWATDDSSTAGTYQPMTWGLP